MDDGPFDAIMLYIAAGVITIVGMYTSGEIEEDASASTFIAVGVFWPVFAIKYLVIGIWSVMSAGWGVLV